ncbi:ADP-ribosylation factor-like protein 6-interacting protein 1 [Venturia canescens]|uniref:ADP-ribosylation factor-like protein 6-interacting protein 1 n=1 Tax=Venturia canescens TaxID=32260 RepID=UPI001C9C5887|nr:ADP-ribosylation factor-like protein 6-interacting protein 1 [Venturia canescens]
MPDNATTEKDKHMKQLKRRMECWREIVLHINSILLWEKSWYPGLILGLTTSIALFVWILEPAFLTIIALCLATCALIDYLVPIVAPKFVSSSAWNGQKERKFDEICQTLSAAILYMDKEWKFLLNARNNRPHTYYWTITICLLILAWIGNTVNNLLLIYLTVNCILLIPGLHHKCGGENAVMYVINNMMRRKMS